MKEAIVCTDTTVKIQETSIPTPGPNDMLLKVEVFGLNPKDWKYPQWRKQDFNSGSDIAGTIEVVGKNVTEFKKGDRVATYHTMFQPGGGFAEFALAPANITFCIPPSISYEEVCALRNITDI